jgi:hypothetical protein
MGLTPWAWADWPDRGRVLVSAVLRDDRGLRLAVPEAEWRALGLVLPAHGEMVTADGQRHPVQLASDGRLALDVDPRAARVEVMLPGRPSAA